MKIKKNNILLVFLLTFSIHAYAQQKPFMDYLLSWDGYSSILAVELTYAVSQKDSTVFIFGDPNFGGQSDIFKVIKNIRVIQPEVLKINENNRQITVYHNGAEKHRITYEIDGSLPVDKPTKASQRELFRPVIEDGLLTLVSKQFTLEITDTSNPLVSFSWRGYPKNISYFNSVHPTQTDPSVKLSAYYDRVSEMVYFVMGDNIDVKEYSVMNIPYYCVTTKEDNYGNDLQECLSPFFESYFPSIHRFWKDANFPFYFLAVTALQNNQVPIGGGGFGIRNGFVMKLGQPFGTWEKYVTAHETAHTWIGIKIMLGMGSFDHQWFGEGFNDYTTLINLVNSKIYGKEDFLKYMNEKNLKLHYNSEVKGAPNDSIAANYWTDYANYGKLPYRRGLLYAFYLDNQIRLASKGKYTLRNMLLDLYKLRKNMIKDKLLTVTDFIEVGAAYIDKTTLEEQIVTYMIEGEPIDFDMVRLIDEFEMKINKNIPELSLMESADLFKIYHW
ncbi:MAG: hypothetical protein V7691_01635 [Galbibacter orientalis]|uniref:hypothetical protein n=1 Tax=Galbibacter orientalis TaxID=453852 RepID=UPI003001F68F